ncbi:hypothetical protein CCC_00513 [Paramagnetospirillum magnetotacticum MS-1]|uniref:Uncharacterized protein n=1 Tax=Paramagnetospirillum magnetotacticum MS-1 TaxID=272627 RepID=A0A0C2U7K3_PARME|nr:hypothetical protein [Paramagnetospirillum magnetotacticum]KIL97452.1 hypothetical protein CCC_00513 [Paramagnetospirillum magnetotacticum MS-1]
MGGFFAPDPPSPPAPVVLPATPSPEDAAASERLDAINRNRRGLLGTIATSETGVLQSAGSGNRTGKTLLGE